jgi:hypothetical protein
VELTIATPDKVGPSRCFWGLFGRSGARDEC